MNIPNGWTRCPAGTIARLATNLALKRQRQTWLTGLAWAAGAVLAIAGSWATAGAVDGWLSPRPGAGVGVHLSVGCSTPPASNPAPSSAAGCGGSKP